MIEQRVNSVLSMNEEQDRRRDPVILKVAVAAIAIGFIAAPVAYGAYEVNVLSVPVIHVWRWPIIGFMAACFAVLAWWVAAAIHRQFPYS